MKKPLAVVALILGILFVALAIYYWITPANVLPTFIPGYDAAMATPHFKHGLASLIVAVLLFIYAWFATGTTGSKKNRGPAN
jgi:hypothetical protein